MKLMNNHYGQSRIFGKARCKIPMELQYFAEDLEPDVDGGGSTDESKNVVEDESEEPKPTVEELMTQLAQERAEKEKLKVAKDKANSEAAKYRKNWEAKASAEEQESNAINERLAMLEKENAEMKSQARISIYSKRYMGIGADEKTAESLSKLTGELVDQEKFFSTLGKFVEDVRKKAAEDKLNEVVKNNPDFHAGSGNSNVSLALEKAKEIAASSSFGAISMDSMKSFM